MPPAISTSSETHPIPEINGARAKPKHQAVSQRNGGFTIISIIIPTLNEERSLPPLLDAIRQQEADCEVIVVDGGSRDRTLEIARRHGVRTLVSSPDRGTGICIGAQESRGEVLLFLHADSTFLPGALGRIREALSIDTEIIGGNFRLVFDGDTPFSRWLTSFYAWIRSIGFYYGDSGIFVRRSVYEALGGFRPIPLMEDLEFVCRLEWFGRTCCIMDPPLITSSRRFEGRRPGKSSSGGSGCTYYSGSAYLLNGWLKFTGRGAAVGDLGGTNQPARPFAQTWSEPRRPADKLFDRHEDRVPDLALDVLR